jgi:hypothetical protein
MPRIFGVKDEENEESEGNENNKLWLSIRAQHH